MEVIVERPAALDVHKAQVTACNDRATGSGEPRGMGGRRHRGNDHDDRRRLPDVGAGGQPAYGRSTQSTRP